MGPSRFVTYCFLYTGSILLVQSLVVYGLDVDLAGLAQFAVAASVLATGVIRLRSAPESYRTPTEYGLFTHSLAVLSVLLTALFVGQLMLF